MSNWPENDQPNAGFRIINCRLNRLEKHEKRSSFISATKLRQANCKAQWLGRVRLRSSGLLFDLVWCLCYICSFILLNFFFPKFEFRAMIFFLLSLFCVCECFQSHDMKRWEFNIFTRPLRCFDCDICSNLFTWT